MTPSQAELDLLRLIALCKDIPINCGELFHSEIFSAGFIESLHPYIVKSKCKLSYRLSEKGYGLLERLNVPCAKDSAYVGKGKTMNKRLIDAKVVLSMYSRKLNIFSDQIPRFIPTFAFRRKNSKGVVLGASQFVGLIEQKNMTYIVFYFDETTKLKSHMEINAAKRFMLINDTNSQLSMIFMSEDKKFAELWALENGAEYTILREHSEKIYFEKIGD